MRKFCSSDLYIVSSIDSFINNLDRFLYDLLLPLVPDGYSCKDTFPFVSQIKIASLFRKYLVFYEVTSLFTNILLQETIDITTNLFFNHNLNLSIIKKEL